MPRFLLFGAAGQIGRELGKSPNAIAFDRNQVNITDYDAISSIFENTDFDAVINAAAYTDVERAEKEPDLCELINSEAPGYLAERCAEKNVPLIHISSEFVFDGTQNSPYRETDFCRPLSVYGRSKLNGENKIIATGATYLILRTSWVFSAQTNNFVWKIQNAAKQNPKIFVVDDEVGAPTPASDCLLYTSPSPRDA